MSMRPKHVGQLFDEFIVVQVAKRDVALAAVLIDIDAATGRAQSIERLLIPETEAR